MEKKYLSESTSAVLEQEEHHGARVAFWFRMGFLAFALLAAILNSIVLDNKSGIIANFVAVSGYGLLNFIHFAVLRYKEKNPENPGILYSIFPFLAIFFDYLIILTLLIFWQLEIAPENPGFSIKNPLIWWFLIPVALSIFQFKMRLVFFALFLFLLIYSSLIIAAWTAQAPLTDDWYNYVMGDGLILADVFTSRPLPYIALCISIAYSIYRAMLMIRRIGKVEEQKGMLTRYFAPQVADEILKIDETLKGKRQKVTILFSDIRGFTAMSETMDPELLAEFLGSFRKKLVDSVFSHNGTVDKFIGDAIMATFGTPVPSTISGEDASNAVLAAFSFLESVVEFNLQNDSMPQIEIGIGIHTGEVFAGNIGSGQRLEYTVLGDAVNTASRIESLCKKLSSNLIISEAVYNELDNELKSRFSKQPMVRVKGKEQPLVLFGVQG